MAVCVIINFAGAPLCGCARDIISRLNNGDAVMIHNFSHADFTAELVKQISQEVSSAITVGDNWIFFENVPAGRERVEYSASNDRKTELLGFFGL